MNVKNRRSTKVDSYKCPSLFPCGNKTRYFRMLGYVEKFSQGEFVGNLSANNGNNSLEHVC